MVRRPGSSSIRRIAAPRRATAIGRVRGAEVDGAVAQVMAAMRPAAGRGAILVALSARTTRSRVCDMLCDTVTTSETPMNLASCASPPLSLSARRRRFVRRRHRRAAAQRQAHAPRAPRSPRRTGPAAIDELKKVNDPASADWNNLMGYSLRKADPAPTPPRPRSSTTRRCASSRKPSRRARVLGRALPHDRQPAEGRAAPGRARQGVLPAVRASTPT